MTGGLADTLASGGPWLLPLTFVAGLCTSLNPCAYPMMGAVVAYVWAQGERVAWRSALLATMFLLGLASVYCALGILGSMLAPLAGLSRAQWTWIAAGVCIVAGAVMAGLVRIELPSASPVARFWGRLRGWPGAFVLGALMGVAATPCATPPLAAILSLAAARQAPALGALLMFVYAIGHGAPAIVIGLVAGKLGGIQRLEKQGRVLQLAGGWLMVGLGVVLIVLA